MGQIDLFKNYLLEPCAEKQTNKKKKKLFRKNYKNENINEKCIQLLNRKSKNNPFKIKMPIKVNIQ